MTPDSIADGLSGPFAGETALAVLQAHGVESVLVTEEEIEEAFRFLYSAGEARLRARRSGRGGGRFWPDKAGPVRSALLSLAAT